MSESTAPPPVPSFVYFTEKVHHEPYEKISPSRPELSAQGKNVVVTGGGTGIGKAIAIGFAQAGANSVSILGRREDRLISGAVDIAAAATSAIPKVLYEVADITKRAEVDKALKSIVDKVGKLDILVSNAGVLPAVKPLTSYETEDLISALHHNVLASFNATQAFVALASPEPTIINISSGIGHMAPIPGFIGHATTKAATLKMLDYLAAENPNIHVVNVQPGTVATEMSAIVNAKGKDARKSYLASNSSIKNFLTSSLLAELPGHFCVWLASPEAKFLRAKYVWTNWDVEEMMARADEIKNSKLLTVFLDGVPM